MSPPCREDFKAAIFCALTLEATAVDALFDERWDKVPRLQRDPIDSNLYTPGRMGTHNVVLVHIPSVGKVDAAVAAANTTLSFPCIQLALVVGICGSLEYNGHIPISLGDVIISTRIIEYDAGELNESGFKRRGKQQVTKEHTGNMRAFLGKLSISRCSKTLEPHINKHLEILQSDFVEYKFPGFKNVEQNNNPAIHFGVIASGDIVMKDAKWRDELARGEGILAYEMEGAGVSRRLPSVVIKGVSDYADGWKSDKWQKYAAGTAAATAKSFLQEWAYECPENTDYPEAPRQELGYQDTALLPGSFAGRVIPQSETPFIRRSTSCCRSGPQYGCVQR